MNVLNYLPKSEQPKTKRALQDICQAETLEDAEKSSAPFIHTYETKYPETTACLQKDREELMTFFDFPANHRQNILHDEFYCMRLF